MAHQTINSGGIVEIETRIIPSISGVARRASRPVGAGLNTEAVDGVAFAQIYLANACDLLQ